MKLNPFKMISSTTQKMLLGGLVGSISYYADLALSEQAGYPAELKGKIIPQLPRNDEIITSVAPPAVMWLVSKKKPKLKEIAKGTILYSIPHLVQRVIVNATNPASVSFPAFTMPAPTVSTNNKIYPQPILVATPAPVAQIGKYR